MIDYDADDTIESIESFICDRSYAHPSGALTVEMVMSAYIEIHDIEPDHDEIYMILAHQYESDYDHLGQLIFRAVLEF